MSDAPYHQPHLARRRAAGLVQVRVWVPTNAATALRAYAAGLRRGVALAGGTGSAAAELVPEPGADLGTLHDAERQAISTALVLHEGNKKEAAAALGISRSTVHRKLRELGINVSELLSAPRRV